MCQYWMSTFPCGCPSWRSSGYRFCSKRWIEPCEKSLERFVWKTFCPGSRKALKNVVAAGGTRGGGGAGSLRAKYTADTRLPPCCADMDVEECMALCTRCSSLPAASPDGEPSSWHCPGHLERVSKIASGRATVGAGDDDAVVADSIVAEFEKAVVLWPVDHQRRYFRRKDDKGLKGKEVWWSF